MGKMSINERDKILSSFLQVIKMTFGKEKTVSLHRVG